MIDNKVKNILAGQDRVLKVDGAAKLTGYKQSWIYGLVYRREIPHFKKGHRLYFLESELLAWMLADRKKTGSELSREAEERLS